MKISNWKHCLSILCGDDGSRMFLSANCCKINSVSHLTFWNNYKLHFNYVVQVVQGETKKNPEYFFLQNSCFCACPYSACNFFYVHKVWIYVSSSVQKMSSFVNKFCCGYSKTNYVKSSSFQNCLKTEDVTTPPHVFNLVCTLEKQGILLTHCFNLLRYTSFLCSII